MAPNSAIAEQAFACRAAFSGSRPVGIVATQMLTAEVRPSLDVQKTSDSHSLMASIKSEPGSSTPEIEKDRRYSVWQSVLALSFEGSSMVRWYVQTRVKRREMNTGRFQEMPVLPRHWDDIKKKGHIVIKGYLAKDGALRVGRFWTHLKYGDTDFELEMNDGWPVRIWLNAYHVAVEFYPIESIDPLTSQRKTMGVHVGQITRAEFEQFDDVIVTTRLDGNSNLKIGGGRPDVFGVMPAKEKAWAQLTNSKYPFERVELLVKNGLLCEMKLLDAKKVRYFTRLWSKKQRAYTTSFLGQPTANESAMMNPDDFEYRTYKPDIPSTEEVMTVPKTQDVAPKPQTTGRQMTSAAMESDSAEFHVLFMLEFVKDAISMQDLFERVRKNVRSMAMLEDVIARLGQLGCPVIRVGNFCKLWTAEEIEEWQSEQGIISRQAIHGRLNVIATLYPKILRQADYDDAIQEIRTWAKRMAYVDLEHYRGDADREIRALAEKLNVKFYFLMTGHHPALPKMNGHHENAIQPSKESA